MRKFRNKLLQKMSIHLFIFFSFFLPTFLYQNLLRVVVVILAIKIITTGCISLVTDSANAIWHNVFHV